MDKISAIITTYCGAKHLVRAIESVLNQTYKSVEVIVVDDNDPNSAARVETARVMEKYAGNPKVMYIKHSKNFNGSAARNTGLATATGKYIQFLDDDDYFFSEKFERSLQALYKYPECDFVVTGVIAYGAMGVADLSGAQQETGNYVISREWIYRFNALGTGSNIFATKESIQKVDGFDTSYQRMQDIEFVFRYCKAFKVCAIPDRLIVKALNERPMKINCYWKHAEVLNKFITQFKQEIISLVGPEEAEKWLTEQYAHLFRIALADGDKHSIEVARKELEEHRSLSKSENIKIKFPRLWSRIRTNAILRAMVTRKREGTGGLEQKLTDIEQKELERFILLEGINVG